MKNTKNYTITNPEEKINFLIEEYIAWAIDASDASKYDLMKLMLTVFTPEDLEHLGWGDTMREFLEADDSNEDEEF